MPPILTVFPPIVSLTAIFFTSVSVVIIAFAAFSEPVGESALTSAGAAFSIGSIGRTWPMTPVEATTTSSGAMPSSFAAISHILRAFSSPSALQVLALPELQITACALPSAIFFCVTKIGAPLTKFCV